MVGIQKTSIYGNQQTKDSSRTYIHLPQPRIADLFEEFTRAPHLPDELIYVPPQYQPLNPEDEDDVVPDQHAAFGIQKATQSKKEPAWRDLGLKELVDQGPGKGETNVKAKLEKGGQKGWGGGKMPR
ncbi:MAG: hypothetical protein M1834_001016 [Cirrosporium novae-zelandiae]|nr:MAG: hypothetical protein M1834_001016 [Cirrosporium novae-zelandiae]